MTDPTIQLDAKGEVVRMINREGDPEVIQVMEARDSKGNPEKESDPDFDYYANLTDEDLAREFEKLTPADKIRYNEWFDFHTRYQRNTGIGGTVSQIVRSISNQNKPLIPEEIPKREYEQVDFDPDQVQIEKMVDKDGREIKCVKPILIKREIEENYASQVPFELRPGEDIYLFKNEERVPLCTTPLVEYYEEATDEEDYKEDDEVISVDSDSSAAESMLDEDFETTDPLKIDQALQQISKGLCQAAEGYEALRDLLPTIPVTEVAEVVQAAPMPYLQPMSRAAIQALQTLGEEHLINQACLSEYKKGVSQAALMRKYGVGRDKLYKVIHGKGRPGGTQYQTTKKEEVKIEPGHKAITPRKKEKGKTTTTDTHL